MSITFHSGKVMTPARVYEDGALVLSDRGIVEYIGRSDERPDVQGARIDLNGKIICPGFIDIHQHGGFGVSFERMDPGGLRAHSKWLAEHGVVGYLRSIAAPDDKALIEMIESHAEDMEDVFPGAKPLGLHLEGPYLSLEKKGAFSPSFLRTPDLHEAQAFYRAGGGWIKQITIAPELPEADAVAGYFAGQGVVVALGHSNLDFEGAASALRSNFTHVTHAFNAMSSFSHRAPGVTGAVLVSEGATAELIADGIHVHPVAMKLLARCLGVERVVLISDAISAAGLSDGQYELVGQNVTVKGNEARLADGTLAGSMAVLDECVRNMNRLAGIPLDQAVRMASQNPANIIEGGPGWGEIRTGITANLVVIDEQVNVYLTVVDGQIVFSRLNIS